MSTTAPLLRAWRDRLGLSQSRMAARIGMSLRTYQEIEQGRNRADDALVIALLTEVLGVDPTDLD